MGMNAGGNESYKTHINFENEISDLLEKAGEKVLPVCLMYATTKAPVYRAYMQANRPWRDRTGAAKQRLNVQASNEDDNVITLTFSHGVTYGIWLELAKEKRYAILMPSINAKSGEFMDGIATIFDSIFK